MTEPEFHGQYLPMGARLLKAPGALGVRRFVVSHKPLVGSTFDGEEESRRGPGPNGARSSG